MQFLLGFFAALALAVAVWRWYRGAATWVIASDVA
jgi:hypothetical protein